MTTPIAGYLQAGTYTAQQDRLVQLTQMHRPTNSLTHGVVLGASTDRLTTTIVSGFNIRISPGFAMVAGYSVIFPTETLLTIAASTATARRDLVIVRVYDAEAGDASNQVKIELVKGTTTTDPALPSSRCLIIAQFDVAANASSLVLWDRRPYAAAAGGVLPIIAMPTTPADIAELSPGQYVHALPSGDTRQRVGSSLAEVGAAPIGFWHNSSVSGGNQGPGSSYDAVVVNPVLPAARWIDVSINIQVFAVNNDVIAGNIQLFLVGQLNSAARYHSQGITRSIDISLRGMIENTGANPEVRIRNVTDGGSGVVGNLSWNIQAIAMGRKLY